jgi:hypothetical protein
MRVSLLIESLPRYHFLLQSDVSGRTLPFEASVLTDWIISLMGLGQVDLTSLIVSLSVRQSKQRHELPTRQLHGDNQREFSDVGKAIPCQASLRLLHHHN